MRNFIVFSLFAGILGFIVSACKEDSEAALVKMEQRELAKGIRFDSLFLGLNLGMSNKDFYARCWEMNKQGTVLAGSGNESVSLKRADMKYPVTMNFYPKFQNNKISEMPIQFQYDSWAPWVRQAQPDSLQMDVLDLMEKWYGKGFIKMKNKDYGLSFVKVDGNRRIFIHQQPEMFVRVIISDLTVAKGLEKPVVKKG